MNPQQMALLFQFVQKFSLGEVTDQQRDQTLAMLFSYIVSLRYTMFLGLHILESQLDDTNQIVFLTPGTVYIFMRELLEKIVARDANDLDQRSVHEIPNLEECLTHIQEGYLWVQVLEKESISAFYDLYDFYNLELIELLEEESEVNSELLQAVSEEIAGDEAYTYRLQLQNRINIIMEVRSYLRYCLGIQ